jgi:hypothetical protein
LRRVAVEVYRASILADFMVAEIKILSANPARLPRLSRNSHNDLPSL